MKQYCTLMQYKCSRIVVARCEKPYRKAKTPIQPKLLAIFTLIIPSLYAYRELNHHHSPMESSGGESQQPFSLTNHDFGDDMALQCKSLSAGRKHEPPHGSRPGCMVDWARICQQGEDQLPGGLAGIRADLDE